MYMGGLGCSSVSEATARMGALPTLHGLKPAAWAMQKPQVRHIEEEARHCHSEEAAEFLRALMHSTALAEDTAEAKEGGQGKDGEGGVRTAPGPVRGAHPRLNMCEVSSKKYDLKIMVSGLASASWLADNRMALCKTCFRTV